MPVSIEKDALAAFTQACDPECGTSAISATCSSIGGTHLTTFREAKYDFAAEGVYRLLKSTTACGCDVEVEAFHASNWRPLGSPPHGATSTVAVAMRAGLTTFVVESDMRLTVHHGNGKLRPDGPGRVYTLDDAVEGVVRLKPPEQADIHAARTTTYTPRQRPAEKGASPVTGWSLPIPGGGELTVFSGKSALGLPSGGALSAWLSLPHAALEDATGLCAQACVGAPALPNGMCGGDVCLPVYAEESIFPAALLQKLESTEGMKQSTRTSYGDCQGRDNSTYCDGNSSPRGLPDDEKGADGCASVPEAPITCATSLLSHPDVAGSPGHWWAEDSIDIVFWGPEDVTNADDALVDCGLWCENFAIDECLVSNALLQGAEVQMACGFQSKSGSTTTTGTCAVVIGRNLEVESLSGGGSSSC